LAKGTRWGNGGPNQWGGLTERPREGTRRRDLKSTHLQQAALGMLQQRLGRIRGQGANLTFRRSCGYLIGFWV